MVGEQRLEVGSRLPSERQLASTLGVSRPTIREALLALELVGCVEVQLSEGAFVGAGLMPHDAWIPLNADPRELLDARRVIEPSLARRVAEVGISEESGRELKECLRVSAKSAGDYGDLDLFVSAGLDFHKILARASGNSLLCRAVTQLIDVATHPLWMLANRATMGAEDVRRQYVKEHELLSKAIVEGDVELAASLMTTHVDQMIVRFFG